MKNLSTIVLILTTLICAYGGTQVLGKLNMGAAPASGMIPILAVSGLITLALGASGYFKARSDKKATPLIHSLSLVIGALALMMALYFLLP